MDNKFEKKLPKNYSSCRELRNLAEKQRRDKLNHYVNELSALVPFVAEHKSQKRVDKISVLRLAASYIRLHKIIDKENVCFSTKRLASFKMNASQSLLKAIGGFLLVVSSVGKVIYASEAIEEAFGYTQTDILGQTIYQFIHEDDKKLFKHQLTAHDSPRRSFYCRMLEKNSRSEPIRYEIIHVVGTMKQVYQEPPQLAPEIESSHGLRPRKRSRSANPIETDDGYGALDEETYGPDDKANDNNHMLISFVKIVRDRPITEVSWIESTRDEYITRHAIDGTISHVDHRISFVLGMMPKEVFGQMAYGYMHEHDVMWSVLSNRRMLMSAEGQGEITLRLACRNGKFVAIRCRGFVEINKSTGQLDSFVCINTLLSTSDAKKEMVRERLELTADLQGQNPRDIIKELKSQLPPSQLSLLRNLLKPELLQHMLNNPSELQFDSDTSPTTQGNDLARKFASLNDGSKLSAEEMQFPVISCKHPDDTNTVREAKRFKHSLEQSSRESVDCLDLSYQNDDGSLVQNSGRSRSINSFDDVHTPMRRCYPQTEPEYTHNRILHVIQQTPEEKHPSYGDSFNSVTPTFSSTEFDESDSALSTNVSYCVSPLSENGFLESSCKEYLSGTIFSTDDVSYSEYNS